MGFVCVFSLMGYATAEEGGEPLSPSDSVAEPVASSPEAGLKSSNKGDGSDLGLSPASGVSEPIATLSEAELQAANKKLRQALELYYQESYRLALPIFRDVAAKLDTMDVRYWLGRSAFYSDKIDFAIKQFEGILERKPDLHQVRLDLALAYLKAGKIEEAYRELNRVRESKPPQELQDYVNIVVAEIGKAEKKLFIAFRGSLGTKTDSNVNAGPDDSTIELPAGGELTGLARKRDTAITSKAGLDVIYDFGEKGGFLWRNKVDLYQDQYLSDKEFDFSQVDFRTSLENHQKLKTFKLGVGSKTKRFASKKLSESYYLFPKWEYKLRGDLQFDVDYLYEEEKFDDGEKNGLQNNTTHHVALGPKLTIGTDQTKVLSLQLRYTDRNADSDIDTGFDRFSYHQWEIGPYYFVASDSGTEFFVQPQYANRRYDGASMGYLKQREDDRYTVTAMASQSFMKRFFASTSFSYVRNKSNTSLFEYDKYTFGVDLGINLEY